MDILSALFQQKSRLLGNGMVGFIVPDVVLSEDHTDTLTITALPVENGANISDHAYKAPATLTMQLGFAGGGSLLDFYDTTTPGQNLSLGMSPRETYQKILDLQALRVPFDVTTGKRHYSNMLIQSIEVTTAVATENVLSCKLILTQVTITSTQTTQVAEKINMTQGMSTSPVVNTGQKTTVAPANPPAATISVR